MIHVNEDKVSLYEVTVYALKSLKIKVSQKKIKELLYSHPDFPFISSISCVLTELNIKNKTVRLNNSQFNELKPSFFALTIDKGLIYVKKIENNIVTYFSYKERVTKENVTQFKNKWNGIIIVFDSSQATIEDFYIIKRIKSKLSSKGFWILFLMLVLFITNIHWDKAFSFLSSLLITKLLGALITVRLYLKLIRTNIKKDKFCTIKESVDCSYVIKSTASKLFGFISMIDISIVYFSTGIISMILILLNNFYISLLQLFTFISLLSIPYTLFSIYYQAFVIKKWCTYCLSIILVLWLESIISIIYIANHDLQLNSFNEIIILLLLTISVSFSLFYLKEVFIRKNDYNEVFYLYKQLISKKKIFDSLHLNAKIVESQINIAVELGKKTSKYKLLMVINPYCPNCGKEFEEAIKLFKIKQDILSIHLIFGGDNDPNSRSAKISILLLELSKRLETIDFFEAVMYWFKVLNIDKLKKKYTEDITENTILLYDKHLKWVSENSIMQTPKIFLNNKEISNDYQLEYLKNLLN